MYTCMCRFEIDVCVYDINRTVSTWGKTIRAREADTSEIVADFRGRFQKEVILCPVVVPKGLSLVQWIVTGIPQWIFGGVFERMFTVIVQRIIIIIIIQVIIKLS